MKNALMKFAGFFVEKVPVEGEQPAEGQDQPAGAAQPNDTLLQGQFASVSGATAVPGAGQAQVQRPPINIALRAWVPQDYAQQLQPHGLHVIAAGGELTSEQARQYGAHVLVVSGECLGSNTHFLTNPQLPTVFISSEPILAPPRPGVVYANDPLHASELATAAYTAYDQWMEVTGATS